MPWAEAGGKLRRGTVNRKARFIWELPRAESLRNIVTERSFLPLSQEREL